MILAEGIITGDYYLQVELEKKLKHAAKKKQKLAVNNRKEN